MRKTDPMVRFTKPGCVNSWLAVKSAKGNLITSHSDHAVNFPLWFGRLRTDLLNRYWDEKCASERLFKNSLASNVMAAEMQSQEPSREKCDLDFFG